MSLLIKHGVGTGRTISAPGLAAQGLPFTVVLGLGSSPEDSWVRSFARGTQPGPTRFWSRRAAHLPTLGRLRRGTWIMSV